MEIWEEYNDQQIFPVDFIGSKEEMSTGHKKQEVNFELRMKDPM